MDVCSQAGRTIADVCWKQRRSDCLRQPNCLKQSLIASGSSASPFYALLAAPPNANFPTSCTVRTTWRAQILRDSSAVFTLLRAPAGSTGVRTSGWTERKCRPSGWDGAVAPDFSQEIQESFVTLACNNLNHVRAPRALPVAGRMRRTRDRVPRTDGHAAWSRAAVV